MIICMKEDTAIEFLAETLHNAWMRWATHLMEREELSAERIARWQRFMRPYSELDEAAKEQDRREARIELAWLRPKLLHKENE